LGQDEVLRADVAIADYSFACRKLASKHRVGKCLKFSLVQIFGKERIGEKLEESLGVKRFLGVYRCDVLLGLLAAFEGLVENRLAFSLQIVMARKIRVGDRVPVDSLIVLSRLHPSVEHVDQRVLELLECIKSRLTNC